MAKDKLKKFAAYNTYTNTYDFAYDNKGYWHTIFDNKHPIVLELGCGKGEYTVALGRTYPEKNFIGIDIKSNRMWKGASIALQDSLNNVAFLRAVIHKITELFAPAEADEIWITFPDPFPKPRHAKHRLTHPRFLGLYKQILKPNGLVHFKTDDTDLFKFTTDMLPEIGIHPTIVDWDVHANPHAHRHLKDIRTHYENLFMGKGRTIKYAQFSLDTMKANLIEQFIQKLEAERKSKAIQP
jgi:tRNA (guanine-N7-)-methyltransferase